MVARTLWAKWNISTAFSTMSIRLRKKNQSSIRRKLENGNFTINPDTGSFQYTPDPAKVAALSGAPGSVLITFIVPGKNDPPMAEDDSYMLSADDPIVKADVVEPNDSDPENDKLTIVTLDGTDVVSNVDGNGVFEETLPCKKKCSLPGNWTGAADATALERCTNECTSCVDNPGACGEDEDCIDGVCVESGICTAKKEAMCDDAYAAVSGKKNQRAKCCPDTRYVDR